MECLSHSHHVYFAKGPTTTKTMKEKNPKQSETERGSIKMQTNSYTGIKC